jgi:hypothetical protein
MLTKFAFSLNSYSPIFPFFPQSPTFSVAQSALLRNDHNMDGTPEFAIVHV